MPLREMGLHLGIRRPREGSRPATCKRSRGGVRLGVRLPPLHTALEVALSSIVDGACVRRLCRRCCGMVATPSRDAARIILQQWQWIGCFQPSALNPQHSTLNFFRGEEVGDYEGAATDIEYIVGSAVAQSRMIGFLNSWVCSSVKAFCCGFPA